MIHTDYDHKGTTTTIYIMMGVANNGSMMAIMEEMMVKNRKKPPKIVKKAQEVNDASNGWSLSNHAPKNVFHQQASYYARHI